MGEGLSIGIVSSLIASVIFAVIVYVFREKIYIYVSNMFKLWNEESDRQVKEIMRKRAFKRCLDSMDSARLMELKEYYVTKTDATYKERNIPAVQSLVYDGFLIKMPARSLKLGPDYEIFKLNSEVKEMVFKYFDAAKAQRQRG